MKKLYLLLLALVLCLPAFAEESAEIALVPAGTFSDYADFEDDFDDDYEDDFDDDYIEFSDSKPEAEN